MPYNIDRVEISNAIIDLYRALNPGETHDSECLDIIHQYTNNQISLINDGCIIETVCLEEWEEIDCLLILANSFLEKATKLTNSFTEEKNKFLEQLQKITNKKEFDDLIKRTYYNLNDDCEEDVLCSCGEFLDDCEEDCEPEEKVEVDLKKVEKAFSALTKIVKDIRLVLSTRAF